MNKFEKISVALILLIGTSLVLLFSSQISPLYVGTADDQHIFLTIGNGIRLGKIPYRDLYDQKGPMLFLIYSLASVIECEGFLGVYIIEIVFVWAYIYTYALIIWQISKSIKCAVGGALVLLISYVVTYCFYGGGTCEELMLPFLIVPFLFCIKALYKKELLKNYEVVLIGMCVAMVFWSKYTICGLYVGILIYLYIYYNKKQSLKVYFNQLLLALLGFLLISGIIFGYFCYNHALKDLWDSYFLYNLLYYTSDTGLVAKFWWILKKVLISMKNNIPYTIFIGIGFIYLIKKLRESDIYKYRFLLLFVTVATFSFFIYFGGGGIENYAIPYVLFTYEGFIALYEASQSDKLKVKRVCIIGTAILWTIAWIGSCHLMIERQGFLFKADKQNFAQYRFAKEIKDASLIEYGFLDRGFFTYTNTLPTIKYFHRVNVSLPEMYESQFEIVKNGEVEYVVTRGCELEKEESFEKLLYQKVDEWKNPGNVDEYYLYKRKDLE